MPRRVRWRATRRKGYRRASCSRTCQVLSSDPSSMTTTSKTTLGVARKVASASSMNSGKFSASSLAGTSTETSGVEGWGLRVAGALAGTIVLAVTPLDSLAHACGQHSQLVPVLRHGPPRDLNSALLEDIHDCLIRERVLRILFGDELLDLGLDTTRRNVFSGGSREAGREEKLE